MSVIGAPVAGEWKRLHPVDIRAAQDYIVHRREATRTLSPTFVFVLN